MAPSRFALIGPAALLFSLSAATCNQSQPPLGAAAPSATPAPTAAAPALSQESGSGGFGGGDDEKARQVLAGIPGMDFSQLSAPAQRELADVFTDGFCYCGCPHGVGQCLRQHKACKHVKRLVRLAAIDAQAGATGPEIIHELEGYYETFGKPRAALKVDERMCRGAKDAKVTVVEFSDFECPFCGRARPELEQLAKDHADKVRFCYAPFPLDMHPNAIPAGQAALYARDHGKFWEMHDALFEHQLELSVPVIQELAGKVGLNVADLKKAMAANKYVDELHSWKDLGRAAKVEATPSIFFNGRLYHLTVTEEALATSLEDELEWTAGHNAWIPD